MEFHVTKNVYDIFAILLFVYASGRMFVCLHTYLNFYLKCIFLSITEISHAKAKQFE